MILLHTVTCNATTNTDVMDMTFGTSDHDASPCDGLTDEEVYDTGYIKFQNSRGTNKRAHTQ